jgi:D-sedoheptulose 7-phosphate isomerase
MSEPLRRALDEAARLLQWLRDDVDTQATVDAMVDEIATCFEAGGRLLSCGNGGSMCDAMHLAEELSGRFRDDRPALDATAISDPGHLTCTANDYGFERVFSRAVEAHGRAGDVLVGFTTSGNSPNVLAALRAAHERGMRCFGLLGKGGGAALDLCDHAVVVPAEDTGRIQEIHIKVVHALIEGVERRMFPANYAD